MKNIRKILALVVSVLLVCNLVPAAVFTASAASTELDLEKGLKYYGRTYTKDGVHWFNWSGAGFTFNFKGDSAEAVFVSSAPGGSNTAYIKIYVDGVATADVALDQVTQTVTLATGLDASTVHTITVLKRTNARSSSAGVKSITISGEIQTPATAKKHLVEFVGDSLTVGYASMGSGMSAWSTATEDVTQTYIPAICEAVDADWDVIAVSGRGIARNYGGDTDKLIPYLYTKLDEYNNPGVDWDYSFLPEVIVINMGTNDEGCISSTYTTADFTAAYTAFITEIRKHNADAYIICVYSLTNTALKGTISNMVKAINEAGDTKVSYLKLETCTNDEKNLGHPNAAGYAKNVQLIVDEINRVTGWDKEPVQTEPVTTEEVTTAELTTAEATTVELTTAEVTTAGDTSSEATTEAAKSGCGSAAFAGLALTAVAALPLIRRKKED